jgi:hypothetical protein
MTIEMIEKSEKAWILFRGKCDSGVPFINSITFNRKTAEKWERKKSKKFYFHASAVMVID